MIPLKHSLEKFYHLQIGDFLWPPFPLGARTRVRRTFIPPLQRRKRKELDQTLFSDAHGE